MNPRAPRTAGWSLVELLVALALSSTVLAGALTAWMQGSGAYRTASGLQRTHERAQYAFATLASDILMAGYFGAGQAPAEQPAHTIPPSAAACGVALVARLDIPVETTAGYELPCAAPDGVIATSHTLTLRRASAAVTAPRAGRPQWLARRWPPLPGTMLWSGTLPPDISPATPHVAVHDLVVRHYYVARRSEEAPDQPALRVKTLTEIAGTPGFTDTEVMHGIEGMQVTLLPTSGRARTARVTLQLRNDAAPAGTRQVVSLTRIFALRNVVPER